MTLDQDRATLAERYAGAMNTTQMRVLPTPGDVDILIAAGWVRDGLSAALFRLRNEWDLAAGEYRLAAYQLRAAEIEVRDLCRQIERNPDPEFRRTTMRKGCEILRRAERAALTARALALVHLQTLDPAKKALCAFAIGHATRERFLRSDDVVSRIAMKALEVWLDEVCRACSGVGYLGGNGLVPRMKCPNCDTTGRRPARLGDSDADHEFGRSILSAMERKAAFIERAWARWLRKS